MQCPECQGVGTRPTGRYESCAQCGGSGHGAATDVACMGCAGSGRGTIEVRDTCFNCHGGGIVADPPRPQPAAKPQPAASGRPPKSSSAKPGSAAPPSSAPPQTSSKSGKGVSAIALVAGGIAGFAEYSKNGEPVDAVVSGLIVFALVAIAIFVLLFVLKLLVQVAKLAVPVALVLAVGNFLDWQWAEDATAWLAETGGDLVEAAETAWAEASET